MNFTLVDHTSPLLAELSKLTTFLSCKFSYKMLCETPCPQCLEVVWPTAYHAVMVHFTSDLLDLHLRALDLKTTLLVTRVAGNLYTGFDMFANKRVAESFELTDIQSNCTRDIWTFPPYIVPLVNLLMIVCGYRIGYVCYV